MPASAIRAKRLERVPPKRGDATYSSVSIIIIDGHYGDSRLTIKDESKAGDERRLVVSEEMDRSTLFSGKLFERVAQSDFWPFP